MVSCRTMQGRKGCAKRQAKQRRAELVRVCLAARFSCQTDFHAPIEAQCTFRFLKSHRLCDRNSGFGCRLFLTLAIILNKYPKFWKEKFHTANGKAQHALKVPWCFTFKIWGGWGEDFFSFLLCWGRWRVRIFLKCPLSTGKVDNHFSTCKDTGGGTRSREGGGCNFVLTCLFCTRWNV
jgi:hypothetical protein